MLALHLSCAAWTCLIVHFDYRFLGWSDTFKRPTKTVRRTVCKAWVPCVCGCGFNICMWLHMQVCTFSWRSSRPKVTSERRTWHLGYLLHSKDFLTFGEQLHGSNKKKKRLNYKDVRPGCVRWIIYCLTLGFMAYHEVLEAFICRLIEPKDCWWASQGHGLTWQVLRRLNNTEWVIIIKKYCRGELQWHPFTLTMGLSSRSGMQFKVPEVINIFGKSWTFSFVKHSNHKICCSQCS